MVTMFQLKQVLIVNFELIEAYRAVYSLQVAAVDYGDYV